MEWLLLIGVVIVAIFIYNGLRTRCPACGLYVLHPKDREGEKRQVEFYESLKSTGLGDALDNMGSSLGTESNKPGYVNAHFFCKRCGLAFTRSIALHWLTVSNKLGEDVAIREYQKLGSEGRKSGRESLSSGTTIKK